MAKSKWSLIPCWYGKTFRLLGDGVFIISKWAFEIKVFVVWATGGYYKIRNKQICHSTQGNVFLVINWL